MNNLPLILMRFLIVGVLFACAVVVPFIAQTEGQFMLMLFGCLALLAAAFPILIRKNFNLFEPITFVVGLVLTGVTLKLLYICAFGQYSGYVVERLLLGFEPERLMYGTGIVAIGILALSIGYCLRIPPAKGLSLIYLPRVNRWHGVRLQFAIVGLFVISLVFFGLFILQAGVSLSSLESLSAKRFSGEEGSSANRINTALYYFYRLAAFSKYVFYLSLAWVLHRKLKFTSGMGLVALISLFQSMALYFVISSRASIVLVLIDAIVIYYLLQDKIELKKFVAAGAIAFVLLTAMLASRDASDHTFTDILEKTFAGRDLMDISKTSHIINAVPDTIQYRYGETLYGFLVAPIPRSMWPDKPMWAERGSFLMMHVFGDKYGRSGMPPGLIAEYYWNFGVTGVLAGMFFMGILFRQVFEVFQKYRKNPTCVVIYTIIVTRLTIFSIGNDFGTGFLKVALDLMPLFVLLYFFGVHVPPDEEDEQDVSESIDLPQQAKRRTPRLVDMTGN